MVKHTDSKTLQGFVLEHTEPGAKVYTDDASAYDGLPFHHETVKHSVSEYVRDHVHTNGVESFWSTLKRAHNGVFHKISPKHLNRYVQGFVGKHNVRDADTLAQMTFLVVGLGWEAVDVSGADCGDRFFVRRSFLGCSGRRSARAKSPGEASPYSGLFLIFPPSFNRPNLHSWIR